MTTAPAHRLRTVIAALVVVLAACGGGGDEVAVDRKVAALETDAIPAQLLGLSVAPEDVSALLEGAEQAYADAVGLYSLRAGDELQATLQVSRLSDDARFREPRFRSALVNQIGSSQPARLRMGEDTVYLSSGNRQSLAVWFDERYLFVLSARDDFRQPRTLLREALELEL